MPENTAVTVKMLMDYLSKYPPYYKVIIYQPPRHMGYRVLAPRSGEDNPWMYSSRAVYIPIKAVRSYELPKYRNN